MIILTLEVNHEEKSLIPHIRAIDEADTLNEYYQLLGCQCIDMVAIDVDGYSYDVVCDDEGLFREPMVPTLFISEEQVLCGDLAFVKIDEEGYTVGLEKEDIERLLRYIENQKDNLHLWTMRQINRQQELQEVQNNIA
jgi:hypothetical protein